ncbi:hypothetical protein [Micromonospora sp. NPDC049891]|uniref:hypothetical protein n=1 Tax=Micromonospora sp. NPDC049891 TaxID=3155655 RepID=UPI0033D85378
MTRDGVAAEIGELAGDLATYLSRAGNVERLLRLFADDHWLQRRVSPETRQWEAYARDLALAWEALEENLTDRPGAIVDCVRLAVIRSTLTTVEDFPAAVVAAAVRTGYWTPERSLSTIDRLSRAAERAVCCHGLLATADLDVRGRRPVESRLIQLAGLPANELPARTLLSGLRLMSSAGREAVAIAIQETARVVEWQIPAGVAGPELRHEDVVAADAVEILIEVPEARTPRLVERIGDALLEALTELAAERDDDAAVPELGNLAIEMRKYVTRRLLDRGPRLARTRQALTAFAELIPSHPDPAGFRRRLEAALASAPESTPSPAAWETPTLASLMPSPPSFFPTAVAEATSNDKQVFEEFTRRAGGPAVLAALLTAQELSPEDIGAIIEVMFRPGDVVGQFVLLQTLAQSVNQPNIAAAVHTVKAQLLCQAISHAFRTGTLPVLWESIPSDLYADADLQRVLDLALTLPAEEQRSAFWHTVNQRGLPPLASNIPRLAALQGLLQVLTAAQRRQAFDNLRGIPDTAVRRLAMAMLGPYLSREQARAAIADLGTIDDARELAWAYSVLGAPAAWAAAACAEITDGTSLAEIVKLRPDLNVVAPLRRMDHNNRLDALWAIAGDGNDPLPPELTAEILDLPADNERGSYSWRAMALGAAAHRVSDDWLPAAWVAASNLPRRLRIGDAALMGYHWSYEYPQAAVVQELAPRLTGPLARRAFEAVRDLPWLPREDTFATLAKTVDANLAGDIADAALAGYHRLRELPDGNEVAWDGTVIPRLNERFRGEREARLAELIAALADRLDPERLRAASRLALDFRNVGPRAWLPARLMPHLDPADRRDLLASALVGALAFVGGELDRLDLVADLMPFVREELARSAREVIEFVHSRFPEHGPGFVLDEAELAALDRADHAEYVRLLGLPPTAAEVRAALTGPDAEPFLTEVILRPFYSGNLAKLLARFIADSPAASRPAVLVGAAEILPADVYRALVDDTLDELTGGSEVDDEALAALIPLLDDDGLFRIIDVAAQLDGPALPPEPELACDIFRYFLDGLRRLSGDQELFDTARRNLWIYAAEYERQNERMEKIIGTLRGDRVDVLLTLAEHLPPSGRRLLLDRVGTLPDLEQADAIMALLPRLEDAESRAALREATMRLRSPLARFWALFGGQNELEESPEWTGFASVTAERFANPLSRAGARCLLSHFMPDEQVDRAGRTLDEFGEAADEVDRLRMLAAAAHGGRDDSAIATRLAATVAALRESERIPAALLLARRDVDLGQAEPADRTVIVRALSAHLRRRAGGGRAALLAEVATLAPLLRALNDDDQHARTVAAISAVTTDWHW